MVGPHGVRPASGRTRPDLARLRWGRHSCLPPYGAFLAPPLHFLLSTFYFLRRPAPLGEGLTVRVRPAGRALPPGADQHGVHTAVLICVHLRHLRSRFGDPLCVSSAPSASLRLAHLYASSFRPFVPSSFRPSVCPCGLRPHLFVPSFRYKLVTPGALLT
jgi:hypothetical protein